MNKHFELYIKGKVQGVRYRKSCAEAANAFGILGYVKNMPDGSVFCEAEGEINGLIDFLTWCEIGPENAEVESVLKVEGKAKGYTNFCINE